MCKFQVSTKRVIPDQVLQVANKMVENAEDAGYSAECVYVSFSGDFKWDAPPYEWRISDNFDRLGCIVYRPDQDLWYFRGSYAESDSLMNNGFLEAMAAAGIFFTG